MPTAVLAPTATTRSSLEVMLELMQKRDELPKDVLPALPARPMSRGRPPSSMMPLPPCLSVRSIAPVTVAAKDYEIKASKNKGYVEKEDGMISGLPNLESFEDNSAKVGGRDCTVIPLEKAFGGGDIAFSSIKKIFLGGESPNGIQARPSYLQKATIVLQSFVRGERARCKLACLRKRQVEAVVVVQSVLRGWLVRKHFMLMRQIGIIEPKSNGTPDIHRRMKVFKEQPWVHLSVVKELHVRILNAEAAVALREHENVNLLQQLQQCQIKMKNMEMQWDKTCAQCPIKEHVQELVQRPFLDAEALSRKMQDENAALKLQLQQCGNRLSEYEIKMKSMEEMWQKQIASLQANLDAARKNFADYMASHPDGQGTAVCENLVPRERKTAALNVLVEEFERKKQRFENDARHLAMQRPGHSVSTMSPPPEDEFRKLKSRFTSWQRDYKGRLRETKSALESSGLVRPRKGWWWCMKG